MISISSCLTKIPQSKNKKQEQIQRKFPEGPYLKKEQELPAEMFWLEGTI